jgi:hypothetical protein
VRPATTVSTLVVLVALLGAGAPAVAVALDGTGLERHKEPSCAAGFDPPQYQFLAFPGEEPPSIECNEDAAGQFTN